MFQEWLERCYPERAQKILGRIKAVRGGKLNSAEFGDRMVGSGPMAEQIAGLFQVFARKYGLDGDMPPLDCTKFRPPRPETGQLWLF